MNFVTKEKLPEDLQGRADEIEAVVKESFQESFIKTEDVPDELRGNFASMQAAYTKKAQEIAEQRKYAELGKKIQDDPKAAINMIRAQYDITEDTGEVVTTPNAVREETDSVDAYVKELITPMLESEREATFKQITTALGPFIQEAANAGKARALSQYPEADLYSARITELKNNNNLSWNQAYSLAKAETREAEIKSASALSGTGGQKRTQPGTVKSYEEAFKLAIEEARA